MADSAKESKREITMNVVVLIVESLVIVVAFCAVCVTMMTKNPESMVADYPPDIREAYYQSQGKEGQEGKITARNYIAKCVFLLVALAVVVALAALAGARSFWQGFLAATIYVLVIFLFDTFILDWIFFPRVRKWRLPGTENMDKEYAQKWFHVKACIPMIPVFLVFAVLAGLVIMAIH